MRSELSPVDVGALAGLWLLLCASHAASPEVLARVGGVVELQCGLPLPGGSTSGPLRVVEWVRRDMDTPVLIQFGAYAPRVHPIYEGRVSLVRNTALRVKGLVQEDQGWYECRVLLLDKPSNEPHNGTWTLLSVTAPPTFTRTPPPVMEALVGNPLSLVCVANGNPLPTITWIKDGVKVRRDEVENGLLSIRSVNREAGGQYTCLASNTEGSLAHNTTLRVKGPPVIVIPPRDTSLNMSQNALLRCQAVADPPNMTYLWQRGRENVHHVESLKSRVKIMVDGTLLISGLLPEDSGNYTCTPTNGLLTPPTASAHLAVQHPAQPLPMPRETYLPTGTAGLLNCPLRAQPPLLRVDWTKDGRPLDLATYPGWTLTSEGSVSMATVNDDVTGVYACTPYNSYGTLGQSEATTVILKDPPWLTQRPEPEYREEVGSSLAVPCLASEDPDTSVTWRKVGSAPRSAFSVAPNGSLLLQPLTKDHQGAWECRAANRVAAVTADTSISVLGTSPHAATSLSVVPGVDGANVSWAAGFDGGSSQSFSIWVKQMSGAPSRRPAPEWFSVAVPPSAGTSQRVEGLTPATLYQISVLARNRLGTGPFSQICSVRTLDPTPGRRIDLRPPAGISANRSSAGVVLRWSPPVEQVPPLSAFVLQSRVEQGEWSHLLEDIDANQTELVVPGLRKDCVYELRMLSRREDLLSEPSPSINVSTMGLDAYPDSSRLLELVPEPLLAGVMGGVGLLSLLLLLFLGTACFISHKRERRRRKRQEALSPSVYNAPPALTRSSSGSPDSVLKKKLLSSQPLYPSSTTSSSSCSTRSNQSSHGERPLQLLSTPPQPPHYTQHRSYLPWASSSQTSPPLELISRGPDGRFLVHDQASAPASHPTRSLRKDFPQSAGPQGSPSFREKGERREPPFVLSVDLPPCGPDPSSSPTGRVRAMAQHLSQHGRFYLDAEQGVCRGPPDRSSLYSDSSASSSMVYALAGPAQGEVGPTYPSLKRASQPPSTASTLVLQMVHERETGNLSKCLRLAKEREELERELRKYTLERSDGGGGRRMDKRGTEEEEESREEANVDVWKPKDNASLHSRPQASRGSYNVAKGPSSPSFIQWEARPLISPTSLVPAHKLTESQAGSERKPIPDPSSVEQTLFLSTESHPEGDLSHSEPPAEPPSQRGGVGEAKPAGREDDLTLDPRLLWRDSASPSQRQRQRSDFGGALSPRSFTRTLPQVEPARPSGVNGPASPDVDLWSIEPLCEVLNHPSCNEMSVDDPVEDGSVCRPARPMLHQRIASHLASGGQWERPGEPGGSVRGPEAWREVGSRPRVFSRARSSTLQAPRPRLRKALSVGSSSRLCHQSSQSLDSRGPRQASFLTPDAWVDSLSQESFSTPFSFRPGSLSWGPHCSSPSLEPPRHPDTPSHPPPPPPPPPQPQAPVPLSRASPKPPPPPTVPSTPAHDPRRQASIFPDASRWPITYQEALRSVQRLEALKQATGASLPSRGRGRRLREPPRGPEDRGRPPPASLLRGYSWPSPQHHAPPPPPPPAPEPTETEEREEEEGTERREEEERTEQREEEERTEERCHDAEERREERCRDAEVGTEERCHDAEVGGYHRVPESGGSYSSFASSGRGSMEHANGRLSFCLSPTLGSSPETIDEAGGDATERALKEEVKGRKASVDENYEWDSTDESLHPAASHLGRKGLFPSVNLLKPAPRCGLPSMHHSREALKEPTHLQGHDPAGCYEGAEPETVLF